MTGHKNKKNPWIAAILNLIFWGAGYYYAGEKRAGIIFLAIGLPFHFIVRTIFILKGGGPPLLFSLLGITLSIYFAYNVYKITKHGEKLTKIPYVLTGAYIITSLILLGINFTFLYGASIFNPLGNLLKSPEIEEFEQSNFCDAYGCVFENSVKALARVGAMQDGVCYNYHTENITTPYIQLCTTKEGVIGEIYVSFITDAKLNAEDYVYIFRFFESSTKKDITSVEEFLKTDAGKETTIIFEGYNVSVDYGLDEGYNPTFEFDKIFESIQ